MKAEGAGNKVMLIFLLCAALALFLYIRPKLFAPEPSPSLIDRLPNSEIIGRYNLHETAKETQSLMFKNKIPLREYFTSDFLLSQAKSIGIDIQSTGYFFSDGKDEWGTFVSVLDSSRIQNGFERLDQYLRVSDTTIYNKKLKIIADLNLYIYYDKDYILVYQGNNIKQKLGRALWAKHGETEAVWKSFLKKKTFEDEKIVLYSASPKLQDVGLDYVMFAHDSDSLNIKLKSYLHSPRKFDFKEKKDGLSFERNPVVSKSLELHLDITDFKNNKQSALYQWIVKIGKKISFPTDLFFDAWEGDLSLQEGGTHYIKEEVIEIGYDEEFNPIETRTIQQIPVPGYSIIFSVNEKGKSLINALFAKGIITKQDRFYRFLFSPPLNLNIQPKSISAYTSSKSPKITTGSTCSGLWKYKGTDVLFQIDSLKSKEVYGSLEFEVTRFIRKGKIRL